MESNVVRWGSEIEEYALLHLTLVQINGQITLLSSVWRFRVVFSCNGQQQTKLTPYLFFYNVWIFSSCESNTWVVKLLSGFKEERKYNRLTLISLWCNWNIQHPHLTFAKGDRACIYLPRVLCCWFVKLTVIVNWNYAEYVFCRDLFNFPSQVVNRKYFSSMSLVHITASRVTMVNGKAMDCVDILNDTRGIGRNSFQQWEGLNTVSSTTRIGIDTVCFMGQTLHWDILLTNTRLE